MYIAFKNTKREDDLREKVLQTMRKQVLKKIYGSEGRNNDLTKVASHSSTKRNNIQKIQTT